MADKKNKKTRIGIMGERSDRLHCTEVAQKQKKCRRKYGHTRNRRKYRMGNTYAIRKGQCSMKRNMVVLYDLAPSCVHSTPVSVSAYRIL